MARRLLEDMAQLGNQAGKDHQVLLTDVEQAVKVKMVTSCYRNSPRSAAPGTNWFRHRLETTGMHDGIPLEHSWQDMDWENMLITYPRGTPNQ
ncbi:hypothetical protein DL771_008706 [Monosporascus sp. 5C6A]|nr:hypothetical protein DL771_008706 [Monosporascus sp. 5C6A]